jgi:hypothetical protein
MDKNYIHHRLAIASNKRSRPKLISHSPDVDLFGQLNFSGSVVPASPALEVEDSGLQRSKSRDPIG